MGKSASFDAKLCAHKTAAERSDRLIALLLGPGAGFSKVNWRYMRIEVEQANRLIIGAATESEGNSKMYVDGKRAGRSSRCECFASIAGAAASLSGSSLFEAQSGKQESEARNMAWPATLRPQHLLSKCSAGTGCC
jgi:hypothetical protein